MVVRVDMGLDIGGRDVDILLSRRNLLHRNLPAPHNNNPDPLQTYPFASFPKRTNAQPYTHTIHRPSPPNQNIQRKHGVGACLDRDGVAGRLEV